MIEPVRDGFYRITLPMPFRLKHVHIHALAHEGRLALFDTGLNIPETYQALDRALGSIGKTLADIDQVFLTHFHADHCGIAGKLQEISGAKVHLSALDAQRVENNSRQENMAALARNFYLRHGLPEKAFQTLMRLMQGFRRATLPFRTDHILEPHSRFEIGGAKFEVLPAPGHTSGQMCFWFFEERILLAGDHVLPDITPNLSPDVFRMEYRPLKSFLASLESLRGLPVKTVYPAHGDPISNLDRRIDEIEAHHAERSQLIMESLSAGAKTAFEVSKDLFGKDLPDFDQFLALSETYVHLVDLADRGMAAETERAGLAFYERVRGSS